MGSNISFLPAKNQDSINRNGSQITLNTLHQCITAMKEYESKSLDELRFEDYQANRKFSTLSTFSCFGSSKLFGSNINQPKKSIGFGFCDAANASKSNLYKLCFP